MRTPEQICGEITKMKLINKKIRNQFKKVKKGNKRVIVKFFTAGRWTWFATELSINSEIFYGYVLSGIDTNYDEWGFFSLEELEENNVERDLYFKPCHIDEAIKKQKRNMGETIEKTI
jgi:hypothetical protein